MKCLAATQGPKIRVNAIAPGLLLTEWVGLAIQMRTTEMLTTWRVLVLARSVSRLPRTKQS